MFTYFRGLPSGNYIGRVRGLEKNRATKDSRRCPPNPPGSLTTGTATGHTAPMLYNIRSRYLRVGYDGCIPLNKTNRYPGINRPSTVVGRNENLRIGDYRSDVPVTSD